jgi:hypothetical protein
LNNNEIQEIPVNPDQESVENPNQVTSISSSANPVVLNCVESDGKKFSIEVVYGQTPRINISNLISSSIISEPQVEINDDPTPLESPTVQETSPSGKPLTSILKSNQSEGKTRRKKSVSFYLPADDKSRKLSRKRSFVIEKDISQVVYQRKFVETVKDFESNYLDLIVGFRKTKSVAVIKVYNWTRTIDIYTGLLKKRIVLTKYSKSRRMSETVVQSANSMNLTVSDEGLRSVIEIKQEVFDEEPVVVNRKAVENVMGAKKVMDPGGTSNEPSTSGCNEPSTSGCNKPSTSGCNDPVTTVKSKIKKVIREEYSQRLSKKYEENFQLCVSERPENEYYLLEHDCGEYRFF